MSESEARLLFRPVMVLALLEVAEVVLSSIALLGALCFPIAVGHGAVLWYELPFLLFGAPVYGLAVLMVSFVLVSAMLIVVVSVLRPLVGRRGSIGRWFAVAGFGVSTVMVLQGSIVYSFSYMLEGWPGVAWLGSSLVLLSKWVVWDILLSKSRPAGSTCLRCGYNLRGLRGKRCPECGEPN